MPLIDLETVIEIKDPLRGYICLTALESSILDLRVSQRLRNIRWPSGVYKVYPGADTSLMGHMLGFVEMTHSMFDHLRVDAETVERARLTAMLLAVSRGAWGNVMEEYLHNGGADRFDIAELVIRWSAVADIIGDSTFSVDEVVSFVRRGIPTKTIRINLSEVPVNPELMDSLERDAYFAGVDYANIEYNKLYGSLAIAKNMLVISRSARYTLESYLSAGANMFEAVYYHKTVRAAELMLLRVLQLAGSELFPFPTKDPTPYLVCDDFTFHHRLLNVDKGAPEELRLAGKIFDAFRRRDLIKVASVRTLSDTRFLSRLSDPVGRAEVEREIAEDTGIDPVRVYVDFPDRPSVTFYPGRYPLDQLAMFERGSRGYEFWRVEDVSRIAQSLSSPMRTIRVYTTRGYRARVKKVADSLLESFDVSGS
ncbi:MAG: hypothetical protein ACTSYX_11785 [Candidatus Thorarchaeota archaeon]